MPSPADLPPLAVNKPLVLLTTRLLGRYCPRDYHTFLRVFAKNARSRHGITNLYHGSHLRHCIYVCFSAQTAKTQDILWDILSAGGYAK